MFLLLVIFLRQGYKGSVSSCFYVRYMLFTLNPIISKLKTRLENSSNLEINNRKNSQLRIFCTPAGRQNLTKTPVFRQKLLKRHKLRQIQTIINPPALLTRPHQTSLLKRLQMKRQLRLSNLQTLAKFTNT